MTNGSAAMTARPSLLRTQAEKDLIERFASLKAAEGNSASMVRLRKDAFERFAAAGLPHRRIEAYKYTDLRALLRSVPPAAQGADLAMAAKVAAPPAALQAVDRYRLVFVDGAYVPALSDAEGILGVTVETLAHALPYGHSIAERIGKQPGCEVDPIVALNAAYMADGVVLRVATGSTIDKPIEIAHLVSGAPVAATLRHIIEIEAGAKVTFLETYQGPAATAYHLNAVTELVVADRAEATLLCLQTEGELAVHLGTLVVTLGERARLEHFVLNAGAAVARRQVFATFVGEHAMLATRGATLLKGKAHSDVTLVVDHAVPHGTSRELYRAVIDEDARSVFQGKIIVRQHAQKTDGKMASNAVLLSDGAEALNKPELEIFADDVACGHGATAGELDERLKFYLMSRGIPAIEAEKLLIAAFLGEAVDAIENETVRDAVMAIVEAWAEARSEGRTAS
jgi:Fe-S cluster assembly protein SufD